MQRMPKSLVLTMVMVALLLFTTGSSLYAQNEVILECPATMSNPSVDTPIGIKVNYKVGAVPVGGLSLGFHYDSDLIEADSFSTIGTHVTQPAFFTPAKIEPDLNLVLLGWADYTAAMPLPANDSGLLYTIWFTVPAGVSDHCVDIDSSYVAPGGQFIFSLTTGGSVTPAYTDCGTEDIQIGTCGGPVGDPPIAACQDVTVTADADCQAAVAASAVDNGSSDPDGTITDLVLEPAGPYQLGDTEVRLIVTDNDGMKDTCFATITVEDNTPPVVTCPGDITVGTDPGECQAVVDFSATAIDNCDAGPTIAYSQDPGTVFPKGTTTVTVTATDAAGNSDQCTFDVTVNDTEDPVAVCPGDMEVDNDPGDCGAVVTFLVSANDNCPGATAVANPPSGSFFDKGTTTVETIATDAAGNKDTCYFDVTVNDTEAPVVTCPGDQTFDNDPGECGAHVIDIAGIGATDNCDGGDLLFDPGPGFFDVGTTPVQVIAVDASGNADTCSFNIIINDTEDPTVTCPGDVEVFEEQGLNGAHVDFEATADDNCGVQSITYDHTSGELFPLGETTVTATAEDIHGNQSQCSFKITVLEVNDPPVARDTSMTAPEDTPTDGQLQAYDPESGPITYAVDDGPFNGTLTAFDANTGAFTYLGSLNYNGLDSLQFHALEPGQVSNEAWVYITVTPVNDAPVPRDTSITTAEDTPVDAQVFAYDVDGGAISYAIDTDPQHGTITSFDATTGEFTYDPDLNYNGDDEFTFTASNVSKLIAIGTVSITVTPVNDAPTANDLAIETYEDIEVSDQVSGDDVDGDALTFEVDTPPMHGTITSWDENSGDFTYMPSQDYNGDDEFTFRANDGAKAYSAPATVSITIHPVNDPPVAPSKTYIVVKNTAGNFQLPGSDVDGDALFWDYISGPYHGEITSFDEETGEFTYVPDTDLEDVLDSIEYVVSDNVPEKSSVTGWVYLQIVPPAFFNFDVDSLVFEAHEYEPAPDPQMVHITSDHPSGEDFAWTATENADWLNMTPMADSTPSTVTFSVDHTGLLPGTYEFDVLFNVVIEEGTGPEDTLKVYLIVDNPISYDSVVVPTETAMPGDEVTIAIWARNSAPTREMQIPIRFDDQILTYVGANFIGTRWEEAECSDNLNPIEPVLTLYADFRHIPFPPLQRGAGIIAYLTFSVKEGAAPGAIANLELQLGHDFYFMLDENHGSEQVEPVFSPGAIEVDVTSDVGDADNTLPDAYSLAQNYPNPFNPETVIEYTLPQASYVRLTVFNILGQPVKYLVDEYQSAGTKRIVWDGTNVGGARAESGVYFYRITADEFDMTRKMILMK